MAIAWGHVSVLPSFSSIPHIKQKAAATRAINIILPKERR
jgi:hypothetical protein